MATQVTPPDFELSGFYYSEILQDLIAFMRQTVGEITDEDEAEPFIQLLRAIALGFHVNNTLIDAVALESYIDTLKLRESLRRRLKLVGIKLKQAVPATTDLIARLTTRFTIDGAVAIPARSLFSTVSGDISSPVVAFERVTDHVLAARNDRVNHVFSFDGTNFTDDTTEAQSPTGTFTPVWSGDAGDAIYVGQESVLFDKIDFDVSVPSTGIIHGVWEYSEPDFSDGNPDLVVNNGSTLTVTVDSVLGTSNRAGSLVRVLYPLTGGYEDLLSTFLAGEPDDVVDTTTTLKFDVTTLVSAVFEPGMTAVVRCVATRESQTLTVVQSGPNYFIETGGADPYLDQGGSPSLTESDYWVDVGPNLVTTVGFLGQTTPSTIPGQYLVGTDWRELPGVTDESEDFSAAAGQATISFTLPQSITRNWVAVEIEGTEAYWIRYRVIAAQAGATAPDILSVSIEDANHWLLFSVTQGQTVDDSPLLTSDGLPDQQRALAQSPVLEGTIDITCEEQPGVFAAYVVVDNFLNSTTDDRHVTAEIDDFGQAIITWGNGFDAGKIPPPGSDSAATYRIGGDGDGNVAANSITVNTTGIAFLDRITNPRKAAGWKPREGDDEDDIERLKISKPAEVRMPGGALNGTEAAFKVVNEFVASDGSSPVSRAFAIELGAGKVTRLLLMGAGGGALSADILEEIEIYFNGDVTTKTDGIFVANRKIAAENYVPRLINVTIQVKGGSKTSVETALKGALAPDARLDDNSGYAWSPGDEVAFVKIIDVAMDTTPKPAKVTLGGTGTGTLDSLGSITIDGTDTEFLTQLNVGDKITVGDEVRTVVAIDSDVVLRVNVAFVSSLVASSFTFTNGDVVLSADELPTPGTIVVTLV